MIANLLIKHYKKEIIETFKKEFIAEYIKDVNKPIGFSDLTYAMTDMNSKNYFIIPNRMNIPIERLGKIQNLSMFMSAGVSKDELTKLMDAIEQLIGEGVKVGKNAAKIGAICHQVKERMDLGFHTELLYNFAAAQLIREDEQIDKYDNEIQMQKVAQFKKEVAQGNSYFFFHQEALKSISLLYQLSPSEWEELWNDSLVKLQSLEPSLKIYLSETS